MIDFKKIIPVLVASTMVACVSPKKYKAMVAQKDDYYAQVQELKYDSTSLATQNKSLINELNSRMIENVNQDRYIEMKEEELAKLRDRLVARNVQINQLNNALVDALVDFDDTQLSVYRKDGKVYISLSEKLLFKSGSDWVNPKGKEALKEIVAVLEKNPDINITIEGHTDNVPISSNKYEDNWDLSVARATAVVRVLTEDAKIQPSRITAAGRSKYEPVAPNSNPESRSKNRRTEIILSPDLTELYQMLSYKN